MLNKLQCNGFSLTAKIMTGVWDTSWCVITPQKYCVVEEFKLEQRNTQENKSTLSRYNSYPVKCTHSNGLVWWALTDVYTHVTTTSIKTQNISSLLCVPCHWSGLHFWFQVTTDLLSVTIDSFAFSIIHLYKWNHTVYIFFLFFFLFLQGLAGRSGFFGSMCSWDLSTWLYQEFTPFHGWVLPHCMAVPPFVSPLPCWWIFGLFLQFGPLRMKPP